MLLLAVALIHVSKDMINNNNKLQRSKPCKLNLTGSRSSQICKSQNPVWIQI